MSNPVVSLGALMVAVAVAGGCAAHRPHGQPGVATIPVRSDVADGVRPSADRTFAATIESQDPTLSSALAELAIAGDPPRHRQVAERYVRLGILDSAFDHFSAARRLDPSDGAALEGLARIWRRWGFLDRALDDATASVRHAPSAPASHNTLGTVFQAMGRAEEARAAFERVLALDPDAVYAVNNLCYLSLLMGEHARAVEECQSALAIDPSFIPARNNLALAYASSQRADLAQREFEAAGDAAAASYNIGMVHLSEGRYVPASHAFDAASRQRPTWSAARARARVSRQLAAQHDPR